MFNFCQINDPSQKKKIMPLPNIPIQHSTSSAHSSLALYEQLQSSSSRDPIFPRLCAHTRKEPEYRDDYVIQYSRYSGHIYLYTADSSYIEEERRYRRVDELRLRGFHGVLYFAPTELSLLRFAEGGELRRGRIYIPTRLGYARGSEYIFVS